MPRLILAAIVSITPLAASAAEFDLMVGFRSVLAAAIRDEGYNCPDVKRIVDAGPDRFGSVIKVICGPLGHDELWDDKPLRVTAYLEGDFTAKPLRGQPADAPVN
jgi:hypothetical protein